ncbi:Transcription factor jumonji (jmj) family protein [Klebsormidium nitens]|uniref:Transcription factor jumonji (Jmj) family protein n=1 Tax=Klebsormidium nitens TaxID=105231 RepID=A0A1Y1I847_KLENI|nr:Transcription factor jumonji (jmj) family protein [Klebsormidium nitens]|eukprot:GAQ86122.1 Transcription factor jumonji (jmj) family protein [Klebsormidium nitens]
MAQLSAPEQGRKKKRLGFGLQPAMKKGRMMALVEEEDAPSVAPLGKTARERSMNQEKEKQKRRTREEERKKARRSMKEELLARFHKELEKEEEAESISEWIERVESCPVFTPTKEQFEDPLKYIESIAPEVAAEFGICKVIPPGCYVSRMFTGRTKFWDTDFKMEVRKQPLRMVDWDKKDTATKDVNFNKDTKLWTVKELEEWANDFVTKNYENSASMLQLRFIEREFWKEFLLRQNKSVRYASDVPGTVFDDWEALGRSKWNLGTLPTLPDSVLRIVEDGAPPIPGVTEPMLYVGMLFSMFAWHVEDQYLYSINYHHLGAPKTWYGVPGQAAQAFERVAREKVFNLPDDEAGLARTLRLLIGKTIMFPPGLLVDAGVPVCRAVQQPGEFVITFPRSYHAGFSNGFNCGEAVNFAMPDWFAYGAACTRRYRLLRQVQVVAYDELLCKEAEQLHARMHANSDTHYEPTAMDTATMVEFVRLMRWQHWQRWRLANKGFTAEPIQLVQRKSVECALCNHKNYLAYVLCDCNDGAPMCLNHPEELRACRCRPQRAPDNSLFPGGAVYHALELPVLEAIAAEFESQPGVPKKLADTAKHEVTKEELKDVAVLGAAREELMGDGQPREGGASMRGYRRWAPIDGYDYAGAGGTSQCMAIQIFPERLLWRPSKLAPAGNQPATPPQAAPTSGRQPASTTAPLTAPQALPELSGRDEEPSGVPVRAECSFAEWRAEREGCVHGEHTSREMLAGLGVTEGAEVEVAPVTRGAGAGFEGEENTAGEEGNDGGRERDVGEDAEPEPKPADASMEVGASEQSVPLEAASAVAAPQAAEETAEQAQEDGTSDPGVPQVASMAPGRDADGGNNAPLARPETDPNVASEGKPSIGQRPGSATGSESRVGEEEGALSAGADERQGTDFGEVSGRALLEDEPKAPVRVSEVPKDGGDETNPEGGSQEGQAEAPAVVEAAVLVGATEDAGHQGEMGQAEDGEGAPHGGEDGFIGGNLQAAGQTEEGVTEAEVGRAGGGVAGAEDATILDAAGDAVSSGEGAKQAASGRLSWFMSKFSGLVRGRQDVNADGMQLPSESVSVGAMGQEAGAGLVLPGAASAVGAGEQTRMQLAPSLSAGVLSSDEPHGRTAAGGVSGRAPNSTLTELPRQSTPESGLMLDCKKGGPRGNGLTTNGSDLNQIEGGMAGTLAQVAGGQTGIDTMRNATPVSAAAEETAHRGAAEERPPQGISAAGRGPLVGAARAAQLAVRHEQGNGQGQRKRGLREERPEPKRSQAQESTTGTNQCQKQRESSPSGNDSDEVPISVKKRKMLPQMVGATAVSRLGLHEVRASKPAAVTPQIAGKRVDHSTLDLNEVPEGAMA